MDKRSEGWLPANVEVAWGLRERPNRGPKRGLSLPRIVEAAVELATKEGLPAVSMSRVAAELGVATMSLYRYVASKDELLLLMSDAIYVTPPTPREPDEDWRSSLSRWCWEQRAVLHRYPWVLRIPVSGPPVTPNQITWLEQALTSLSGTGLTEGEKVSVMMLLSGFIRNGAMVAMQVVEAIMSSGAPPQEAMAAYGRMVERLADPVRFPAVNAALRAGVFTELGGVDDEFIFGLDRLLDGIDMLIRSR
jgi:AcrR family transcriptional regulator